MTISTLRTEIDRLLYQHPFADTNIESIENAGADINFTTDQTDLEDLRDELSDREKEVADLERGYNEAREEIRKLEIKLTAIERAARTT